jgi:hypothetical protein
MTNLTAAYQQLFDDRKGLKLLTENYVIAKAALEKSIAVAIGTIEMVKNELDHEKVKMARTIVDVGDCTKQGQEGARRGQLRCRCHQVVCEWKNHLRQRQHQSLC